MLDLIRKKQKSSIIKLAFIIIILSFIIGYAMLTSPGKQGGGGAPSDVAATVNGTQISFQQYQNTYRNLYQLYQNIYREQFNAEMEKQLKLPKQALDQLVDQALLSQEAERRGIEVSKDDLVKAIAEIPAFQENGSFSKERYLQVLNYQRLTPDEFEAMQKHQMEVQKVRDQLQQGITVSDEEVTAEYKQQNEKVNLAFVRLTPGLFENRVKVDDQELAAFFADHQEQFRIPEQVQLAYVRFEPASYAKDVVIEDGDIDKYYRRHLDKFEIPEQVKAAHILIKVPKDADQATVAKKRKLAEKVLDEVRAGEDFGELARKYSDDKGSAAKGGELGYFTRGTMVKPFEKAAFALKPGQVSDLVQSSFGFHIIKCEGYIEAGIKPMAEVIDQIKTGLRQEKAADLALEKAMDAYNMNRKTGSLEAAAKANELGVKETNFFSRNEPIEGLGEMPEISATAFSMDPGKLARPVPTAEGVILFTVKARHESRIPKLSEVRERVVEAYRKDRAEGLAKQAADTLLAGLKDGKKLADLAKKAKLDVEETGLFARSYGDFVPRLGNVPELAKVAFTLTKEKPVAPEVYDMDGRFVVATLKAHEAADMKALDDAKRQQLRDSILARKKNEAVEKELKALRDKAEITLSANLQRTLEGR